MVKQLPVRFWLKPGATKMETPAKNLCKKKLFNRSL